MNDELMMSVLRYGAGVWCVWVVWMFYKTFTAPMEPPESGQEGSVSLSEKSDRKE